MAMDEDDPSRPTSRSSAGRRRWEMHSRESFETSLAIETPSPVARASRPVTSAKRLSSSARNVAGDPASVYGGGSRQTTASSADDGKTRTKSAVRKNSSKERESSAEAKHAQKMAEGRRARGASASLDKSHAKENKSSKSGKIPVPVPKVKRVRGSSESISSNGGRDGEKDYSVNEQDGIMHDALANKLSTILNAAAQQKVSRPTSQTTSTGESESKEEGYESDEEKYARVQTVGEVNTVPPATVKFSNETRATAPPLEDDNSDSDGVVTPCNKVDIKTQRGYEYPQSPDTQSPSSQKNEHSLKSSKREKKISKSRRRSLQNESNPKHTPLKSNSHISLQLRKLREDIVGSAGDLNSQLADNGQFGSSALEGSGNRMAGLVVINNHAQMAPPLGNGASISAIYCEKMHGFVLAKDARKYIEGAGLIESSSSERLRPPASAPSRASHAVSLQTCYRTFAVFSQGLLAGLSMAHCVMVFLLAESWHEVSNVLPPRLTNVFYALIVFLTFICFVASCDRCDLCSSSGGLVSQHSLHIPWSAGLYLASLSVTVATTRSEVLLAHRHVPFPSPHQQGGVGWYAWLCLARAIANLLAWIAVVPDPHTDALLSRLNGVLRHEQEAN